MTAQRPTPISRSAARPARAAALVVGLTAGLVALAGCSASNPITTQKPYSASDGVRIVLSDTLSAENLLVLTAAKGEAGTLLGALTNNGTDTERVSIAADGADDVTVRVPAGATVLLTPDDTPDGAETSGTTGPARQDVALSTVPVAPGAVLSVTLSSGAAGTHTLDVPVLDGSLPEYASLVPAAG